MCEKLKCVKSTTYDLVARKTTFCNSNSELLLFLFFFLYDFLSHGCEGILMHCSFIKFIKLCGYFFMHSLNQVCIIRPISEELRVRLVVLGCSNSIM